MQAPARTRPARGRGWAWTRLAVGAAILGVLVWRTGTGAFLEPLGRIDVRALAVGALLVVPCTVACAWRWRLVSRGLGSDLPLGEAVGAYYRSQFLNTVLPGGVLGDVHRGVRRGRDLGDLGHGLRAVVWERAAGQVVQLGLTVLVLLVLPSPAQGAMPVVLGVLVGVLLASAVLARSLRSSTGSALPVRVARAVTRDVRAGLLARDVAPGVLLTSTVAVLCNAGLFLVAARTAGVETSPARLLPLALLVLAATALPTNLAGWGPREGAAAWAFALAGLGSVAGIGTAVVLGAMVFVSTLPGGFLLLRDWLRDRREVRLATAGPGPSPALRQPALGPAA